MNVPNILCCQFSPEIGNLAKNTLRIINIIKQHQKTADLIVFPELSICGYLPKDLLFCSFFQQELNESLNEIKAVTKHACVLLGHPTIDQDQILRNTAIVIKNQQIIYQYHKQKLPEFKTFNEKRYFTPGSGTQPIFILDQYSIGICICEDIWHDDALAPLLAQNPDMLICITASPYEMDKVAARAQRCLQLNRVHHLPIVFCNLVGAHDSMIFDGNSLLAQNQMLYTLGEHCKETLTYIEQAKPYQMPTKQQSTTTQINCQQVFQALTLGLASYINTCLCDKLVIGISGGIDSALTLILACQVRSPQQIIAIYMPSIYSSPASLKDAQAVCDLNQVKLNQQPIDEVFSLLHLQTLGKTPSHDACCITGQNIQARIRGTLLMAAANQHNALTLATSNKSEMFMGYATLYGDMVGALSPIGDLLKTEVFELSQWLSAQNLMPKSILTKEPSAELRPNQKDSDSLPPYHLLDPIIKIYLTQENLELLTTEPLSKYAQQTIKIYLKTEHKRNQAAIVLRVSNTCLTADRKMPIANRWAEQCSTFLTTNNDSKT